MSGPASGRSYARTYRVSRADDHARVESAVRQAGGRVVYTSGPSVGPLFLGVETPEQQRLGITAYVFGMRNERTKNRPDDEHRGQIRYGDVNSAAWRDSGHPLGFDPADVDLTTVLLAHAGAEVFLALDPFMYDPLPLGNSVYAKDAEIDEILATGWHVWERNARENRSSRARPEALVESALETVVGFTPDRLFDYLAFERRAQALGLDGALRFRLAESAGAPRPGASRHVLEEDFGLSAADLLDIVNRKSRLAMAMRGGVAEHHLGLALAADPAVQSAEEGTTDGPPDFHVTLVDGRYVTLECKNASPKLYAGNVPKVEVQKTRASKTDPLSRYYAPSAFDVVAACLYGPTRRWEFKYIRSERLARLAAHPERIAPQQRIDDQWSDSLSEALERGEPDS